MKLLVTRPETDAAALSPLLSDIGVAPVICPLIKIKPLDVEIKNPTQFQAVAITSSNSVASIKKTAQLDHLIDLPIYAVGDASARAARSAGFKTCFSAEGDLEALCALIKEKITPDAGPILYLSGAVISGDLKAQLEAIDYTVERVTLYDAVALEALPEALLTELAHGDIKGAVFYSKRTAKIFMELMEKSGIVLTAPFRVFCLSKAVAGVIEEKMSVRDDSTFFSTLTSPKPDQASMLAFISQNIS